MTTISINNTITRLGLLRSWSNKPTITSSQLYSATLIYTIWLQINLKLFFRQRGCWVIDTYIAAMGDKYVVYVYYFLLPTNPPSTLNTWSNRLKILKSPTSQLGGLTKQPYLLIDRKNCSLFRQPSVFNPFSAPPARQSVVAWGEAAAMNASRIFRPHSVYRALIARQKSGKLVRIDRNYLGKLIVARFVFFKLASRHHINSFGSYRFSIGSRVIINHHRRFFRSLPTQKESSTNIELINSRLVPNWKFSNTLLRFLVRKLMLRNTRSYCFR